MGHKLPGIPRKRFVEALKASGYKHNRYNGGHDIWEKTITTSISIPCHANEIDGGLARRLAKEHNLSI